MATHLGERSRRGFSGRSRSNVWNYRGVNTFGAGRMEELRSHPTVKPVALVADAMRDCTRRRDICQDTFSGSGTTITKSEALRRAPATPFRCGPPRYGCRPGEKAQPTTAICFEMQGEFEKMRRGANCNRAKSGQFSITYVAALSH